MEKKEEPEKKQEIAWNLAQTIIQEISYLLNRASLSFVSKKYDDAMRNLQAVRLRVSANLTDDEKKKLAEIEKPFWEAFEKGIPKGFGKGDTLQHKISFGKYGEYNDLLMSYLKFYGYLIPVKKDRTRM